MILLLKSLLASAAESAMVAVSRAAGARMRLLGDGGG